MKVRAYMQLLSAPVITTLVLLLGMLGLGACKKEDRQANCRITSIERSGSLASVTYTGDSLMSVGTGPGSYKLYFKAGRLAKREEPVTDPYLRIVPVYDNAGKVIEQDFYAFIGGNWVDWGRFLYDYTGGKLSRFRSVQPGGNSSTVPDYLVYWDGDNVKSIDYRENNVVICTEQFSHNKGRPNPMRAYQFLYYGDGDSDYMGYKLAYYFSASLVESIVSSCPLSDPRSYKYSFNTDGLIESFYNRDQLIWHYTYECK